MPEIMMDNGDAEVGNLTEQQWNKYNRPSNSKESSCRDETEP